MSALRHPILAAGAFAAVLSCRCSAAASPAPRGYKTPVFVQSALALDLSVDYDRPAVEGTATLTLVNGGAQPTRIVPLLLNRLMSIREVRNGAGRQLPVQATVTVFEDAPLRQAVYARVDCLRAVAPGERVTLKVAYRGAITGFVDAGNLYVKDRIQRDFTILREDALAFPVLGVPLQVANWARVRKDFAFHAHITVPDGQVVAAGGRLVDRRSANGRTTFEFSGDAVPFLNVAIAPYRLVEKEGVTVYALPQDEAKAEPLVDTTRRALARLESWHGSLRAAPRVTIIEIPEGFGSQAGLNAGIILEAGVFRDSTRLTELYHELTHFWNTDDLDIPSPRWNEGLAMYLQYRLARDLDSFTGTDAALERTRTRACDAKNIDTLRRTPFADFGRADLTDWSYRVGLLMFSALDSLAGAEKLDAGLRAYLREHQARGGTTAEFVASLSQAVSGGVDASAFFRDWMATTGWVDRVCAAPTLADALGAWRPPAQPLK